MEDVLPKLVERRRKLDTEAAAAYALQMAEVSEVQAAMGPEWVRRQRRRATLELLGYVRNDSAEATVVVRRGNR